VVFRTDAKAFSFALLNTDSMMDDIQIEEIQKALCAQQAAEYIPARLDSKLGFAMATKGLLPINGLRHVPEGETCGWYIWCGDSYSEADDFFNPLHTWHVYQDHPEITRLLGLAPGYRFLLAGDYLDIWYDASLLTFTD
jgi:hypothetical protein